MLVKLQLAAVVAALMLHQVSSSSSSAPSLSRKKTAASSYAPVGFVPPASPTVVSSFRPKQQSGWPSAANNPARVRSQIASGYGTYRSVESQLFGRKKGGGVKTKKSSATSTSAPVTRNGKIQIKMLETVPRIGQAGDVIFVSSAVFQNQLQRQQKARLISAEEVAQIEKEKEADNQAQLEAAKATKQMIDDAMEAKPRDNEHNVCGIALEMKRKAGPEGSLFGGISPKMVMDALALTFPEGSWDGKQVKLTGVKDMDGQDVKKKDIKHIGDYLLSVSLGRDVEASFILSISAE